MSKDLLARDEHIAKHLRGEASTLPDIALTEVQLKLALLVSTS